MVIAVTEETTLLGQPESLNHVTDFSFAFEKTIKLLCGLAQMVPT